MRHHEPDEGSDGDPRGRACTLYADCRYSLVDAADLDRIFCVLYEGQPMICCIAGRLVNLSRACAMACHLLGLPYPPGALEVLAACGRYLCGPAFASDPAARVRVAGEFGVPVSAVHEAAMWGLGMRMHVETPAEGKTLLDRDYS